MNKLNIMQKLLEVIQESLPASDGSINSNCSQGDGSTATLTVDTADEQAIKELSRVFAKILNDRDFETLDGRAEYHLYTVDHMIELIKNNDEQNTIKLFKEYKIKSQYEDCEFISITFSSDQEQAAVVYNVSICLISAEGKYFKKLNRKSNHKNRINKGSPFSITYTLIVKKERGN